MCCTSGGNERQILEEVAEATATKIIRFYKKAANWNCKILNILISVRSKIWCTVDGTLLEQVGTVILNIWAIMCPTTIW